MWRNRKFSTTRSQKLLICLVRFYFFRIVFSIQFVKCFEPGDLVAGSRNLRLKIPFSGCKTPATGAHQGGRPALVFYDLVLLIVPETKQPDTKAGLQKQPFRCAYTNLVLPGRSLSDNTPGSCRQLRRSIRAAAQRPVIGTGGPVEMRGLEPLTPALQRRCSPN